jgi:Co/Zn/Cd efflux system component
MPEDNAQVSPSTPSPIILPFPNHGFAVGFPSPSDQPFHVPEGSQQKRIMNLSLAVAVVLLAGKTFASVVTGSSAIYSDAAESVVHVFAVAFAGWALWLSLKPADDTHHFGHDKIAYIYPRASKVP